MLRQTPQNLRRTFRKYQRQYFATGEHNLSGEHRVRDQNEGLWDIANKHMRPKSDDYERKGKGGMIKGNIFAGSEGKDGLSGKFSYHHIEEKLKNFDEEITTEMWLSRPYLDRPTTHFMETGEFIPREGFNDDEFTGTADLLEDDVGNYINKPKIKYPESLTPNYYKNKKKLKLEADRIKYKLSIGPNVYAADLWASMYKHKTEERTDGKQANLDLYEKYHDLATPTNYPLSMPPPRDDWKNWSRIKEFSEYSKNISTNNIQKTHNQKFISEYKARDLDRGEVKGRSAAEGENREVTIPLKHEDMFTSQQEKRTVKRVGYQSHPFDTREYDDRFGRQKNEMIKKSVNVVKGPNED